MGSRHRGVFFGALAAGCPLPKMAKLAQEQTSAIVHLAAVYGINYDTALRRFRALCKNYPIWSWRAWYWNALGPVGHEPDTIGSGYMRGEFDES